MKLGLLPFRKREYRRAASVIMKQAAEIVAREGISTREALKIAQDRYNADAVRLQDAPRTQAAARAAGCTCEMVADPERYAVVRFDPDCPILSQHYFAPGQVIVWTNGTRTQPRPITSQFGR